MTIPYSALPKPAKNWYSTWGVWATFPALIGLGFVIDQRPSLPKCSAKVTLEVLDGLVAPSTIDRNTVVDLGTTSQGRGRLCSANANVSIFGIERSRGVRYTIHLTEQGDQFIVNLQ
jgi:hypothetical protein